MASSSSSAKQKSKRAATASSLSASSSSLPAAVSGFTVLPVAYSSSATHIIYARAHSVPKRNNAKGKQREGLPDGRTLFLVNVPPDATERELTVLFKPCGTVERVVFGTRGGSGALQDAVQDEDKSEDEGADEGEDGGMEDGSGSGSGSEDEEDGGDSRPKKKQKVGEPDAPKVVALPSVLLRRLRHTGHTAYVVFLDSSSLARALKPPAKPHPWPVDRETPVGLGHYEALYAALRPPLDVVRAHADSWMEAFEREQAQKRQQSQYKKGEAIVDEDGFTLVTRGGAYGKTLGGGVAVASKRFVDEQAAAANGAAGKRHRKKKEKKEKDAFYAFQAHEKRRKEIIDLKKKFEEDKAKIDKLKQSRKFRPY